MASISPSTLYGNTVKISGVSGTSGVRIMVVLSISNVSGNSYTIKYSLRSDWVNVSSGYDPWMRTRGAYLNLGGTRVATVGKTEAHDGTVLASGSVKLSGSSFSVSAGLKDNYDGAPYVSTISDTVSVSGLITYYTVTFDLNGGTRTGGGALSQRVQRGGSATPPTCSRTGYTFGGWSGSYTNVTSNRTVTATWDRIQYTVTYNANGGTGAPASQSKPYGSSITLSSSKPTKTVKLTYNANGGQVTPASKNVAMVFKEWNTKSDGSGTSYDPGDTYSTNANLTLYAIWEAGPIGTLPTPTYTDCRFLNWSTSVSGTPEVTASTKISKATTIYASWAYGIIYHWDEELGVYQGPADQEKMYNVNIQLSTITPTMTPEGGESGGTNPGDATDVKEFLGWNTTKGALSVKYNPGDTYTENKPLNLYPVWEQAIYTVTFDLNGGTYTGGGALVQQVPWGGSAVLPNDPTRKNRKFWGWTGGDWTDVRGDLTITATWDSSAVWIMTKNGWEPYM